MVKSFHKKRKNFKNKTKRNKQRRTRKNKNKKMIGGEIGDTASYLGNHVFVGYKVQPVTGGNIAGYNIGSSDVTTSIFVNKNFRNDITNYVNVNYPTKHGNHEPFFPNNIFKNNLFDLLNPLNTDLITGNYWDANNNWGIKNPHIKNILILPYLNLLPNVKNINIYKMILSGVVCFTDEDGNKSINDIINNSNREVIEKMAEFIDFKYYKILEQKPNGTLYGNGSRSMIDDETFKRIYRERCEQLKNEIMTILDYGDGIFEAGKNITGAIITNTITTQHGQMNVDFPNFVNNLKHPIYDGKEIESYFFLKDFIMSLEREYPSLIARVLLETDAELAGEEPRKNRMRRASSILEEGMKKLSSVQMKKNEEERIEKNNKSNINVKDSIINNDIKLYRTYPLGYDGKRYGVLKTADTKSKFEIYEIEDYLSSKNFKIASNNPIGTYDPKTARIILYNKTIKLPSEESIKLPSSSSSDLDIPEYSSSEEEIDITPYKVITLHGVRYAALLSEINNQNIFNIYELKEYKNPRDFKIKSKNPIGTFDNKNKKLKYNF